MSEIVLVKSIFRISMKLFEKNGPGNIIRFYFYKFRILIHSMKSFKSIPSLWLRRNGKASTQRTTPTQLASSVSRTGPITLDDLPRQFSVHIHLCCWCFCSSMQCATLSSVANAHFRFTYSMQPTVQQTIGVLQKGEYIERAFQFNSCYKIVLDFKWNRILVINIVLFHLLLYTVPPLAQTQLRLENIVDKKNSMKCHSNIAQRFAKATYFTTHCTMDRVQCTSNFYLFAQCTYSIKYSVVISLHCMYLFIHLHNKCTFVYVRTCTQQQQNKS